MRKEPNTLVLQTHPPSDHTYVSHSGYAARGGADLTTLCSIVEIIMWTSEERKVFREAEWPMFTSR